LKVWLVAAILETNNQDIVMFRDLTTLKNFAVFVDFVNLDALFNQFVVVHIKIINANGIQERTYRQTTSRLAQFCFSNF
jgi:hypothetical protein